MGLGTIVVVGMLLGAVEYLLFGCCIGFSKGLGVIVSSDGGNGGYVCKSGLGYDLTGGWILAFWYGSLVLRGRWLLEFISKTGVCISV